MRISFLKLVTLVMISLVVSACGKGAPQVVTGIQVQSSVQNQDVILSVQADLNLGNMTFPAVTLPIIDPKGQGSIGEVVLMPVLGGKNQIKISVDVSAIAHIQAIQASLPNGNLVPLIANNPSIVVPLGSGAKLYLTIGANAVAIGVAVPIQQFDGIGSSVGSLNLFPVFAIDKAIGAAGIFTGSQAGQNGFALIVDVTQYVNMQNIFVPQASTSLMKMAVVPNAPANIQLNYNSQNPSKGLADKVNAMIYNLHLKRTKLKLHK